MVSMLLAAGLATMPVQAPKATLVLEVARTEQQREYGLMNRRSLPEHTGMIFVFPADQQIAFWMKDTLIPLDMVFIAADGTVRKVYANVPVLAPHTADVDIPLEPGIGKYVIELPAGEAAQDGITEGVKLDVTHVPPPA